MKIIFVVSVIFLIIGVTKSYYKCPPNRIEYRYIPRTFKEEQDSPIPVSEIFNNMFKMPSPWLANVTTSPTRITGNISQ
jgi:hypothetical protein